MVTWLVGEITRTGQAINLLILILILIGVALPITVEEGYDATLYLLLQYSRAAMSTREVLP